MSKSNKVTSFCQFKYQCDKKWNRLHKTEQIDVKYCPKCQTNVHLVINEELLKIALENKDCIARYSEETETFLMGYPSSPYE